MVFHLNSMKDKSGFLSFLSFIHAKLLVDHFIDLKGAMLL